MKFLLFLLSTVLAVPAIACPNINGTFQCYTNIEDPITKEIERVAIGLPMIISTTISEDDKGLAVAYSYTFHHSNPLTRLDINLADSISKVSFQSLDEEFIVAAQSPMIKTQCKTDKLVIITMDDEDIDSYLSYSMDGENLIRILNANLRVNPLDQVDRCIRLED